MKTPGFLHTCSAIAAAAVLATTAAAWAANTATSDRAPNDALRAADAKVTLLQAITAAEQQAGGKASKAEYESARHGSGGFYVVEVVSGANVFDLKVDATAGTVISQALDHADHGKDRDEEKENED